jgi:hypothetical protein
MGVEHRCNRTVAQTQDTRDALLTAPCNRALARAQIRAVHFKGKGKPWTRLATCEFVRHGALRAGTSNATDAAAAAAADAAANASHLGAPVSSSSSRTGNGSASWVARWTRPLDPLTDAVAWHALQRHCISLRTRTSVYDATGRIVRNRGCCDLPTLLAAHWFGLLPADLRPKSVQEEAHATETPTPERAESGGAAAQPLPLQASPAPLPERRRSHKAARKQRRARRSSSKDLRRRRKRRQRQDNPKN